ncbi:YbjN domain-containing protein [Microcoleus sp. FACHB-1515]|uniref:T3SS (YopN, CesT) and YbjN peptide-binding chaperone 1 n=1 Tax=Cyanophyceae TaxID=3028117 RepID=UPI0016839C18|nr:YbjN domain-containing protein [Microcoleus sp. FACHB-1515]MBD2091806.1 YbjN domain-containing protein [Microcoleus sp. FACHB-1515]
MSIVFTNSTQELTYTKVADYLKTSLFRHSMRSHADQPKFDLLYQDATLIEVEVLPWNINPWDGDELAIVKASSCVSIGSQGDAKLMQYLLSENRKMRFGAFQLDEAGQVLFTHTVLGGENMDLLELQTCILAVAAIANTYQDLITEQFGGQRAVDRLFVNI